MPVRKSPLDFVRRHADLVVAVGLTTLMIVQVWLLDISRENTIAAVGGTLALLAPLAIRTRVPVTLLLTLLAVGGIGQALPKRVLDVEAFGFITLLVVYNGAAHTTGRRAWAAGAITATIATAVTVTDPDGVTFGGAIFFTLLFGAPWLAGYVVQRRRLGESRMRHERDAAEAAIGEERARIARELHDVVAHAVSVIVLQARGGRRLLDTEPEATRGALDTIEHTGQQALVEMRRLVALLRESDEELALAPQPTLLQLDHLVDQIRAAGLPVEISIEGPAVELPPGVDLSAYRIVQEALTNALKHAGPARARVRLRYATEGLDVDVDDDGAGTGGKGGSGYGLDGIRERVSIYGGDLEAGPRSGGGFSVHARLPYASER